MPRRARFAPGGLVYHVLNRAVARTRLFDKPADYDAFERVLAEAHERHPLRILSCCLMPNHWHFIVWPGRDGLLTDFFRWLTHTHTMRWHAHRHSSGTGHLYQGRFKSFPVQDERYLLTACRYVERNALRAGLVERAQDWRWCSAAKRLGEPPPWLMPQRDWPVGVGDRWLALLNRPQTPAEEQALRQSIQRGQPYGDADWQSATAARLHLSHTLRPRGRPRKPKPQEAPA